jgi:transcription antitermination factor NusG
MTSGHCSPAAAWYAIYTRHQHEQVAARFLSGKGFEIYPPLYNAVHRWRDRLKRLSLPLFPCYVFIRGGLDRQLDILKTPGVWDLVRTGARASPIWESEIQAVRRMMETDGRVQPYPFLRLGDWVRIKSGPLVGIEGILVRQKNSYRLVVSVELLRQSASVEVDIPMVERAIRPGASRGSIRKETSTQAFAGSV